MMIRPRERSRGFSLLEFTIALAVLMVLVVSTGTLVVQVTRGVDRMEEEARALSIARGLLAEARASTPPADLPQARTLDIPISPGSPPGASARITWEAWEEGLVKATVSLTWNGGRSGRRRIDLTTLVSRGGAR